MDCIRCARVNRNSAGNFQLENLHATRTKPDTAYHNIKFRANQTDTKNRKHVGLHKYLQRYLPTLCMCVGPTRALCVRTVDSGLMEECSYGFGWARRGGD